MKKEMLTLRFALRAAALLVACAAVLGFSMRAESAGAIAPPISVARGEGENEVAEEENGDEEAGVEPDELYVVPDGVKIIDRKTLEGVSAKKIVLPESVERIDAYAFADSSLEKIEIPSGVVEIGESAFAKCRSLKSIEISEGVKEIGSNAFSGCSSLKLISIPSSVATIGAEAFRSCYQLRAVVFESHKIVTTDSDGDDVFTGEYDGVKRIGEDAFAGCSSLGFVDLPESLEEIGARAFKNCSQLRAVVFGSQSIFVETTDSDGRVGFERVGVKRIGEETFAGCDFLVVVDLPESLEEIGARAFKNCSQLCKCNLPGGLKIIDEGAFSGCSNLSIDAIPDSVANIGAQAFKDCSSLTGISLPRQLERIEYETFAGCSLSWCNDDKGDSVVVPESVVSIGEHAFSGSFKSVSIPKSVQTIDVGAFGSDKLESIEVAEENPNYKSIDGVLYSKDGATLTLYPSSHKNEEYAVLEGTKKIASGAFARNDSLRCISLPASLEEMETEDFEQFDALERIEVAESNAKWKAIDGVLFTKDGSELLVFPEGKRVAEYAVPEGTKIVDGIRGEVETIALPESVEKVERLFVGRPGKEWRVAEGNAHFKSIDGVLFTKDGTRLLDYPTGKPDAAFVVPDGTQEIACMAFGDCDLLKSVVIPEGVKEIDWGAFRNCKSLESVSIPKSVEKFGFSARFFSSPLDRRSKVVSSNGVFAGCESLKSVSIAEGVREIAKGMFDHCVALDAISIPSSVVKIDDIAFRSCESLKSVSIAEGVEEIGESAFEGCESLESVSIPSTVVKIGHSAFYNCKALKTVEIAEGVQEIEKTAFYDCKSLESVYIPKSVTSIGLGAFSYETEIIVEPGSYAEEWAKGPVNRSRFRSPGTIK